MNDTNLNPPPVDNIDGQADVLPDGAYDIERLAEAPADLQPVCGIAVLSNGRAMGVELRFPEGTELDETNPAHVFAWYIAHAAPDLLVAAINSWHLHRRHMAMQAQAANAAQEAIDEAKIVEPRPKILGADGHPVTPEN